MPDVDLTRELHIRVTDPETQESREITKIVAGSMSIEEMITSRDIIFGQMYATKAEFQVYETRNIAKHEVFIYFTENGQVDEIPVFTGIIDSCKSDRIGSYRDVVAYDRSYELSKKNVASWWNHFWDENQTASIGFLRQNLLQNYGVPYTQKVLPNDNVVIQNTYTITSISFVNMLKMLTELGCCFPHFNRSGRIEFITLDTSQTPIEIDGEYEGDNSDFEDAPIKKYTGVQIYDATGGLKYSTAEEVDNPYNIKDSLIVQDLDEETVAQVGQTMFDALSDIEYKSSNVNMIVGGMDLKLGDKVSADGVEFYVFKNSFSNSLLVDQNIVAEGIIEENETEVETVFGNIVVYKTLEEVTGKLGFNVNVLTNGEDIEVRDNGTPMKLFDDAVMIVNGETRVLIDIEVLLTVDTKESLIHGVDIDTYRENDCVIRFKYYYDDALIEVRQPVETLTDGQHIVNLHFSIKVTPDVRHTFYVTLESEGGDVFIVKNEVFATIAGQALVKDGETNDVRCEDTVQPLNLAVGILGQFTDGGVISLPTMYSRTAEDTISRINLFSGLLLSRGFTDSVDADAPVMIFSPWTNADLVDTDITEYNIDSGWQGAGSTILGTAKYVETCDVDDIDHVVVQDHGAVFYASFDEGNTWVAYTQGGWQEGAAMIDTEIMNITPQQWAQGGQTVRIKALLGENFTLYDINCYGAIKHEEEEDD